MMIICRIVIIICLLTLPALSYDSNRKLLNSLGSLKTVYSQRSVPTHSLILLHWFANNIFIDSNTRLLYNPNADFRSHLYRNYELLLPPVSPGYQYYTVGNLIQPQSQMCQEIQTFPPYVIYPQILDNKNMGWNRDRIIVEAQPNGPHRIGQMYLTQHFRREDNRGSGYDPAHTFELSIDLFQDLTLFSFNNNNPQLLPWLRDQFDPSINDSEINQIINIMGSYEAPLGLLFLIVNRQRANLLGMCETNIPWVKDLAVDKTVDWQNCEMQQMQLDVTTGDNGTAQIVWKNVTQNQLNGGVAVVLFKNQMDQEKSSTYMQIKSSEGSFDTSVPLKEGLQARLHKVQSYYIWMKEDICRGEEFKSPKAVPINGYAQLQLYVSNGKACFLLYIKSGCNEWKSDFYYSWVGLYKSDEVAAKKYMSKQWQWAIYFKQGLDSGDDETFEYCTGTTIAPGLQARFMINSYNETARTPEWG